MERDRYLADYRRLHGEFRNDGDFLKLAKFVETHRFNNSTEHLWAAVRGSGGESG